MRLPAQNAKLPPASNSQILELTWEVFGEFCRALAVKVAQSGYQPDIVVGIAKAGVIPGAVIAAILRRRCRERPRTRRLRFCSRISRALRQQRLRPESTCSCRDTRTAASSGRGITSCVSSSRSRRD